MLPWVPASPPPPAPLENVPDLSGGDPRQGGSRLRQRRGQVRRTATRSGAKGGTSGRTSPGSSAATASEVYRDIAEPSARIHPDYVPYTVALKDGRVLVGTVRAEGADAIRVADTEAKVDGRPPRRDRRVPPERHVGHARRAGRRARRGEAPRPDRLPDHPAGEVTRPSRASGSGSGWQRFAANPWSGPRRH